MNREPSTTENTVPGPWQSLLTHQKATDAFGLRRDVPDARLVRVDVDGQKLHRSFASIYRRILLSRLRRYVTVPGNELTDYVNRGANALARITIQAMGGILRNKLEARGYPDLAEELIGAHVITTGAKIPKFVSQLVETFGLFEVRERYHDRTLYYTHLARGQNGRFGVNVADVSHQQEYI